MATKRKSTRAKTKKSSPELEGRIVTYKNQSYQLPRSLWVQLVDEVARRKKLGLPFASQNAIAVESISQWLHDNMGS